MKKFLYVVLVFVSVFSFVSASYAQNVNDYIDKYQTDILGNDGARAGDLLDILASVAGWLLVAGAILAGLAIITAGVVYMMAGNNTSRVTTAKAIFKNGVIGALILFAAGIIVNTIILLATNWNDFFSV